jgi:hypothetical protein
MKTLGAGAHDGWLVGARSGVAVQEGSCRLGNGLNGSNKWPFWGAVKKKVSDANG